LASAVYELPGELIGRGFLLFDAGAMRRFPIAKEGLTYIVGLTVLWVVFVLLGWTFLNAVTFIVVLFVINFFRDPERLIPQVPHAVLAPADGRVIFAGKAFENRFLNSEALKISIFMSIFNVHVNRIPFSGEVESVHYGKGTFLAANLDKASLNNEHNAVVLRTPEGEKIVFVQIAGLVARRIDCWLKPGDRVQRGERFGMIRFGSRLDVFVPTDSRLAISEGHRVRAGESIICYHPRNDKNGGAASRER
jgi:phosphatidylserine decarboxylase